MVRKMAGSWVFADVVNQQFEEREESV